MNVPMWRMFAYMDNDPDREMDEYRTFPEWQLQDKIRWATTRGYDNIYLDRAGETEFKRSPSTGVKVGDGDG